MQYFKCRAGMYFAGLENRHQLIFINLGKYMIDLFQTGSPVKA